MSSSNCFLKYLGLGKSTTNTENLIEANAKLKEDYLSEKQIEINDYKTLVSTLPVHDNTSNITHYAFGPPKIAKKISPVFNFMKKIPYTERSEDKKTYTFIFRHSDLDKLDSAFIKINSIHVEYTDNDVECIYYDKTAFLHKILLTTESEGDVKCTVFPLEGLSTCYHKIKHDNKTITNSDNEVNVAVTFSKCNSKEPNLVVSYSQSAYNDDRLV